MKRMQNYFNRMLSVLVAMVMIGCLLPAVTYAEEDNRASIHKIEGTYTEPVIQQGTVLDNVDLELKVTKGSPAVFDPTVKLSKKDGDTWEAVKFPYTFTEGTYRWEVTVKIEGDAGRTHVLGSECKVELNKEKWSTMKNPVISEASSSNVTISPEFTLKDGKIEKAAIAVEEETKESESSTEESKEPESPTEESKEPESPTEESKEPESSTEESKEPESSTEESKEPESPTEESKEHKHTPGKAVVENKKDATCTAEGSYDEVIYCSECKEEISRETMTIKKLDHTLSWKKTKEATKEAEGEAAEYCTVCGTLTGKTRKLDKLPADPVEYKITKGNGQTVEQNKEASFTSDADIDLFSKVTVDGKDVDAKMYTVKKGSTVVTLKAEFTKSLKAGEHTIVIEAKDGKASGKFTVKKASDTKKNTDSGKKNKTNKSSRTSPKTGDDSQLILWIVLLILSVAGMVLGWTINRYNRKRNS